MQEAWKPIDGSPGFEVSNLGKVFDWNKNKLVPQIRNNRSGAWACTINVRGFLTTVVVHKLVAHAFVPGYFEGAEVKHIDGDKANNCADNLRWAEHGEKIKARFAQNPELYLGDRVVKIVHDGRIEYEDARARSEWAQDVVRTRERRNE